MARYDEYDPDEGADIGDDLTDHGDWRQYPPAVNLWDTPELEAEYERVLQNGFAFGRDIGWSIEQIEAREMAMQPDVTNFCRPCQGLGDRHGDICHHCRGTGKRAFVSGDPATDYSLRLLDTIARKASE